MQVLAHIGFDFLTHPPGFCRKDGIDGLAIGLRQMIEAIKLSKCARDVVERIRFCHPGRRKEIENAAVGVVVLGCVHGRISNGGFCTKAHYPKRSFQAIPVTIRIAENTPGANANLRVSHNAIAWPQLR